LRGYLNVYAPSTPAPADGRAVMYWIYGGSLQFGNAGQQAYDGSWFAAYEDVIVVTVNYRTNGMGYFIKHCNLVG
jgi:acetylcholinesterase